MYIFYYMYVCTYIQTCIHTLHTYILTYTYLYLYLYILCVCMYNIKNICNIFLFCCTQNCDNHYQLSITMGNRLSVIGAKLFSLQLKILFSKTKLFLQNKNIFCLE